MKNEKFIPLAKEYYPEIKKMICDTWQFDKYVPERCLKLFINTVFYSYMCESDYSKIALVNNKVAGVILAHTKNGYFNMMNYVLLIFNVIKLSVHSEGKKCLAILKNVFDCEKKIKKAIKVNKNELLLLIVNKHLRNYGIGSALIGILEKKCKSYCLTTDTLCNYTFYEMTGFQRVNSKQFAYFTGLEEMYLYQK